MVARQLLIVQIRLVALLRLFEALRLKEGLKGSTMDERPLCFFRICFGLLLMVYSMVNTYMTTSIVYSSSYNFFFMKGKCTDAEYRPDLHLYFDFSQRVPELHFLMEMLMKKEYIISLGVAISVNNIR